MWGHVVVCEGVNAQWYRWATLDERTSVVLMSIDTVTRKHTSQHTGVTEARERYWSIGSPCEVKESLKVALQKCLILKPGKVFRETQPYMG